MELQPDWIAVIVLAITLGITVIANKRKEVNETKNKSFQEGQLSEKIDNLAKEVSDSSDKSQRVYRELTTAINNQELHCAKVSGDVKADLRVHESRISAVEKSKSKKGGNSNNES